MSTTTAAGASGQTLKCLIVTPERTILDTQADFVALPLYDGELGILPGRAPLIGRLGSGELRTRSGGQVQRYFIDGGFAQLRANVLTILTSRAIPAPEINKQAAASELEAAQARPARGDAEQAEKAKALDRARAQLRLAETPARS